MPQSFRAGTLHCAYGATPAMSLLLTIVVGCVIGGAQAAPLPSPCTWSGGVCEPNANFTTRVNPTGLSELERGTQEFVRRITLCQQQATSNGCQAFEKQGCIWTTIGTIRSVCLPDLSLFEMASVCPGSSARTAAECNLKRTGSECGKDTRCVWKAGFFQQMSAIFYPTSRRDLCFIKAATDQNFFQYLAFVSQNMNATNRASYFKWVGTCDASKSTYEANNYNATCARTFKPPTGCTTNCASALETQKRACLAAGCAWDQARAADWKTGPSPCQRVQSKYWDLYFGPKARGSIRNQAVQCAGPVASRSKAACESYKLQGISGRRALKAIEEAGRAGTDRSHETEQQQGDELLHSQLPSGHAAGPWSVMAEMMNRQV